MIVLGSTSDVSKAFVEKVLKEKEYTFPKIYLFTSNTEETERFAQHIKVKYGQESEVVPLNILEPIDYQKLSHINSTLLFCATGFLGKNSEEGIWDAENTRKIIAINYANLVPLVQYFAEKMEIQRNGCIIGLSSVAGERGRQSNFMYGSSKAAFTTYLDGLRNYLYSRNVQVITVLPGFMDTKMTEDIDTPKPLTSSPEQAANDIYKAYKKKKNKIYVGFIWRYIMFIIKSIPEFIFKKMKM